MKFVKVEIADADTPADADKKFADKTDNSVWRKAGHIEGDVTPARVTDTVNAITLGYKTEKSA